jgi:anti-anti-sigma factor
VRMILEGELDLASGGPLQARLRALQRAHATVCLDLSRLSFIDCAGLQVLVEALEVAAADGALQISADLPVPVRRLIELIDAAGLPDGAGLPDAAVAALGGRRSSGSAEPSTDG